MTTPANPVANSTSLPSLSSALRRSWQASRSAQCAIQGPWRCRGHQVTMGPWEHKHQRGNPRRSQSQSFLNRRRYYVVLPARPEVPPPISAVCISVVQGLCQDPHTTVTGASKAALASGINCGVALDLPSSTWSSPEDVHYVLTSFHLGAYLNLPTPPSPLPLGSLRSLYYLQLEYPAGTWNINKSFLAAL